MKTLERLVLTYIIRTVYLLSSILPVKKRIVFATYRMTELKDNFKFIYNEVKAQSLDYECICLFKKPQPGVMGKVKYLLHLLKATFYMATSEFFIIDDFYFPVYAVNLRKGTEVIQVWHACGAFKKFGYSIIDKEYGADNDYIKYIPIHKNYSRVLVSSQEVASHYAEAFNMDVNRILPIGIPRTDIFFDNKAKETAKETLYERYPILKEKKLILYAPTFRGASQSDAKLDVTFNIEEVLNELDDSVVLGFKMHPFVKDLPDLTQYHNAVDLSTYPEINDILLITDLLITDYSSIIFEYSLLERPMVFYADDLNGYEQERDFYYKYEDMVPGPIVSDTESLIHVIKSQSFNQKKISEFKRKFFDYADGQASKRFVDQIILKKEG